MVGLTARHFRVASKTIEKILKKNDIKWLSNSELFTIKFKQEYGGLVKMNKTQDKILDIYDSPNVTISLNPTYKRKTLKCAYRTNSKTH